MNVRVLIAEDEEITRKHLTDVLRDENYDVVSTDNGVDALAEIKSNDFDILIADIKMPGMDGLELLSRVKEISPETAVLVITGFGSINSAVEAMKKGAFDYIPKPFELDELLLKVKQIRTQNELRQENIALRTSLQMGKKVNIIAESRAMKKVMDIVEGMQGSDCNVLLTGESGVGKNLLAKAIHHTSPRSGKPFLSLNCATFTEELLASELFGHEKGAFTGAHLQKQGLIKIADGGTLFFDEITEMSPNLQAKLLKAIEEKEFFRVGGTKPVKVDVRFIAATNQNVNRAVEEGSLRRDLYYRLNVMEINVPPLRRRRGDIIPLSRFFLRKHAREYGKRINKFSQDALEVLRKYSYPGNVRELENIIERAVILEKGAVITAESLPQSLLMFQIETSLEPDKVKSLAEINKEYVHSVLEMLGGNKSEASRVLGVSRTSLWRMLKADGESLSKQD